MEKNKNLWIWILVLVVLGLAYFLGRAPSSEQKVQTGENEVSTEDTTGGSVNTSVPKNAPKLSYEQALFKYKDARIQFDKYCDASPDMLTFKVGTEIMLDNRAGVARTIKMGSVYSIKPWGFKIIKLASTKLPVSWPIDCDGQQNVSTLTVQK